MHMPGFAGSSPGSRVTQLLAWKGLLQNKAIPRGLYSGKQFTEPWEA